MNTQRQEIIEKTLSFVANKGWTEHGSRFLDSLAKFLGELLEVDYVLIDKYSNKAPHTAETVAIYNHGAFLPNMVYELIHTPCENVIGCRLCCYPSGIQQLFPNDELLKLMAVDSYIGIPLWSSTGDPIGLIALMDGKILEDIKTVELCLQIVAIKAAHELENMLYVKEIDQKNKKLSEASLELQLRYNELITIEEELRASNEELIATSDALKESNDELIQARDKAEESDRLKTAFLQNMSHEIRTPLNAISGFAGMLNKARLTDEKRKNFVTIIQNSSKQLVSIVSDILTISSLETQQEKLSLTNVRIDEILEDLWEIFKQQADDQNVELILAPPSGSVPLVVLTDQTKLNQILTNLLTNALKFTNKGHVEFGCEPMGNDIKFYVKDTGIGIKHEYHEKIFERFRQADQSINRLYGGNGLGLAISKAFVELLDGRIWLESEAG